MVVSGNPTLTETKNGGGLLPDYAKTRQIPAVGGLADRGTTIRSMRQTPIISTPMNDRVELNSTRRLPVSSRPKTMLFAHGPQNTMLDSIPDDVSTVCMRARALLWICETRLSFTPSTLPISFIVMSRS